MKPHMKMLHGLWRRLARFALCKGDFMDIAYHGGDSFICPDLDGFFPPAPLHHADPDVSAFEPIHRYLRRPHGRFS